MHMCLYVHMINPWFSLYIKYWFSSLSLTLFTRPSTSSSEDPTVSSETFFFKGYLLNVYIFMSLNMYIYLYVSLSPYIYLKGLKYLLSCL